MNPTLTAQAALQQAVAAYSGKNLNSKETAPGTAWSLAAANAIATANIDVTGGLGPNCAGQTAQPMNLLQVGGKLTLGVAGGVTSTLSGAGLIPAAAIPVIGGIVAGVAALVGIIVAIFQHHAQAVARDLQFGCSAIPAVNNAFAVLIEGVQNGTIDPGQAAASLPTIYSQYMAAGGATGSASGPGSIPGGGTAINDSPYCNSNCELSIVVLGMVFYWQSQFLSQAAAAAVASTQSLLGSVTVGGSASTGTPSSSGLVLAIIVALIAAAVL